MNRNACIPICQKKHYMLNDYSNCCVSERTSHQLLECTVRSSRHQCTMDIIQIHSSFLLMYSILQEHCLYYHYKETCQACHILLCLLFFMVFTIITIRNMPCLPHPSMSPLFHGLTINAFFTNHEMMPLVA